MHRKDENGQVGMHHPDVLDQLQSVFPGQGNVHQDKVRHRLLQCLHRLLRVFRFAADLEIRFALDRAAQSLAHHRVIVNDQDAFALWGGLVRFYGHILNSGGAFWRFNRTNYRSAP